MNNFFLKHKFMHPVIDGPNMIVYGKKGGKYFKNIWERLYARWFQQYKKAYMPTPALH